MILTALLLTLDEYSSWRGEGVPMIRSAIRTTLRSLLRSDLVAEPDSYRSAEDGFNDGRVELFQQLLWKVPQLAKEEQPMLGLFLQWSL